MKCSDDCRFYTVTKPGFVKYTCDCFAGNFGLCHNPADDRTDAIKEYYKLFKMVSEPRKCVYLNIKANQLALNIQDLTDLGFFTESIQKY